MRVVTVSTGYTKAERAATGIVRPKSAGRVAAMKRLNAAKTAEQRSAEQAKSWTDPAVRAARIDGIKAASVDPVERERGHEP